MSLQAVPGTPLMKDVGGYTWDKILVLFLRYPDINFHECWDLFNFVYSSHLTIVDPLIAELGQCFGGKHPPTAMYTQAGYFIATFYINITQVYATYLFVSVHCTCTYNYILLLYIYIHIYTYTHTHIHIYIYPYIHVYTHTYVHGHIHIYTHTLHIHVHYTIHYTLYSIHYTLDIIRDTLYIIHYPLSIIHDTL